ncbi:MAG TPA: hypothetical protein DIC35_03615 [Candidatus Moranbacteria bacterium]|nr:hypothetical protein [Candidatus Moranbacteria bacterium]
MLLTSNAFAVGSYFSSDWRESYVLGSGFEKYKNPVIQTCVGHAFGNGLEFSLWNSLPASFDGIGDNAATEIDLNALYHLGFITLGGSYFSLFPDKNEFYKNDVLQVNFEISNSFQMGQFSITPGLRIEYDFPVNGQYDKRNTGLYVIPKIDLDYALSDQWKASLNTQFEADLGGYGAQKALIIDICPKITYQINQNTSLNAGIDIYLATIKSDSDVRQDEYVPRVGISYAF